MAGFLSEFRSVLESGDDLPTLPTVVMELQAALDDELVTGETITEIIMHDPPLATRVLRVANSAAFTLGTPVADINSAIQLLGLRQIRALCITSAVMTALSGRRGGLVQREFWQHSAAVALVARALAKSLGYRKVPPDELYVAGLLHDVGLLVMDQHFPEKLEGALHVAEAGRSALWEGENITLATDHGEIGGLMMGRWGLPPSTISMVTSHHNPKLAPERYRDACWLIYAAEIICGGLGPALPIELLSEERAMRLVEDIRSHDFDVESVMDELRAAAAEFTSVLN